MSDSIEPRSDHLVGDDEVILKPDETERGDGVEGGQVEFPEIEVVGIPEDREEQLALRLEHVGAGRGLKGRDAEVLREGVAFLTKAFRFDDPEIGFEIGKLLVAHGRHLIQTSPGPAIDLEGVSAERLEVLAEVLQRPGAMVQDGNGRLWRGRRKEAADA